MKARISHELLARRAALELQPGQVVNLGSGLASMVVGHVPAGRGVIFHAENGLVGYAPRRGHARGEPDLVDASGEPVSLLPGGAIVNQAESFGMIRGGHVDVGMVEAYQVSDRGDLVQLTASTEHSGGLVGSVEVAAWAKRVVAVIEHTTPEGSPRIVRECSYPAALLRCVDLIVTDAAVIEVSSEGLVLRELAPGWTPEEVQAITGANLVQAPDIMEMDFSQPQEKPVGKIYANAAEAMADIPDGAVILLDGFAGPGGMAQYLMVALRDHGAKNLTMVSNTAGIALVASFGTPPGFSTIDHSLLVDNHQIKKAVASFPVSPSPSRPSSFELAYKSGEAELELVPQGTLAERIRAGGYGIGAFYTTAGAGTLIAEGKQTRTINGREYVLEYGIRGDYALIRAHKADRMGNLVYKGTSRNFNAVMAPAADITIAEVDEIVEVGDLDPDAIVTPGVFVQRVVCRPPDFWPYQPIT